MLRLNAARHRMIPVLRGAAGAFSWPLAPPATLDLFESSCQAHPQTPHPPFWGDARRMRWGRGAVKVGRLARLENGPMRVLIVEDDHRLAASMRRGLEGAGIAADTVYDGEEALAAAETFAYDAILLDLMLPRLDGIELSR